MKVTIDITPTELERIKNQLAKRAMLLKCGFDSMTIEDKILYLVYEASQDENSKADSET